VQKPLTTRFIKESVLKDADTIMKLSKIACKDKNNHKDHRNIDVGFAALAALTEAKKNSVNYRE